MARFFGAVGYGENAESPSGSGVWKDVITEYSYYGDVVRNTRRIQEGDKVNDDLSIGNSISIVADAYARAHIFAMRYVEWEGIRRNATDVEVQYPRLLLTLGGVYSGPTPDGATPAP